MTEEVQQKLVQKYPKLFAAMDNGKHPIFYGIECGDGWFGILDILCSRLQNHIDRKQKENPEFPQVMFSQIKEKFGGLRAYTSMSDETIYALISFAEGMAYRTCELCGNTGKNKVHGGWYMTLCNPCETEYLERKAKIASVDSEG